MTSQVNHVTEIPTANKLDYGLQYIQVSKTSTDQLMRNLVLKIAVFKHFPDMRVLRFFERVGISKGCKLMKMNRKCSYCYKVIVS